MPQFNRLFSFIGSLWFLLLAVCGIMFLVVLYTSVIQGTCPCAKDLVVLRVFGKSQ